MKNNTLVEFGHGAYGAFEDGLGIYASKEKVWTDLTPFFLPKGSPLLARVVNISAFFAICNYLTCLFCRMASMRLLLGGWQLESI